MKQIFNKIIFVVILLLINSGCSDQSNSLNKKDLEQQLISFAGGGLRNPISDLAMMFEKKNNVKVMVDYAGSEVLISKAKLSRQGDIYIPGDSEYVNIAARKDLILSQKSVCYFVPVIFVQKGNPKGINTLKDLIRPGIRVGLGNSKYIPIGRISKKILMKSGISQKGIGKNLKFQSATVNELCMQIQAKSLDAVIVWDAVAKYYSKYGTIINIPLEQNIISTVDAGILKFTKNRKLSEQFISFMCSKMGQELFSKYNYRVKFTGTKQEQNRNKTSL